MNPEPDIPQPDAVLPAQAKQRFLWTCVRGVAIVAIIVLGLAMVWAKLNEAREKARRATCLNSLRSKGLSLRLYSGDNGSRYPCDPGATTIGSFSLLTNNYQTAYKGWICPSDTGVRSGSANESWTALNLSYAYNGFSMTEAVRPDTPLMADRTSGNIRSVTPWVSNVWTHGSDGGTVLYADGHTAFVQQMKVPMYRGKNP